MKKQQARLRELRDMPYQEYLQTPEWQETRKAALKRAGGHCQLCSGKGTLNVHHNNYDNLGCEQEEDVITLCADCHSLFHRAGKLVKKGDDGEGEGRENQEEENTPSLSLASRAWVFGPAALVGVGLPAILHAPPPAAVGGLLLAAILAWKSPKVYAVIREEMLPPEIVRWIDQWVEQRRGQQEEGEDIVDEYSGWDRMMGRHLHGPRREETDDEDELADDQEHYPDFEEEDQVVVMGEPIFPAYTPDVTLRLGQAIDKDALQVLSAAYQAKKAMPKVSGRRFEPHIDSLFGKGMLLAAVQGSGKSILSGLFMEQGGECDVPMIILDHKGEYTVVTELTTLDGLIAGGPFAQKKAERIGVPYFPLTLENADEFVELVLTERYVAVVPLPTYGESWVNRAAIVAEVGQALMRYSARKLLEEEQLVPCLVFLDEAQLYLPEDGGLLPPEARSKANSYILSNLANAFHSLVSNGRSNGYTICFATQSLTYIAKWAIKSCQIRVFMRHVEHNDLETLGKILGPKGVATRDEIESFPPGVGVVFGFTPKPMLVQFDMRQSRDMSSTPGIERLRQAAPPKNRETKQVAEPAQTMRRSKIDIHTVIEWWTSKQITDEECDLLLQKVSGRGTTETRETHVSANLEAEDTPAGRELSVTPHLRVVQSQTDVTRNGGVRDDQTGREMSEFGRNGVTRNDRNVDHETASDAGVRGQKVAVTTQTEEIFIPDGWTLLQVQMLPGFYKVLDSIDKSLKAAGLSTGQRNRDYARELLQEQGLLREAR